MGGMMVDMTLSMIMNDIEASRRNPDRDFPKLPCSHFEKFGKTMLVFVDYSRERGEVYAICLPTSQSTEIYWQFLEDLLREEKYPLAVLKPASQGGHYLQLFAQKKDEKDPTLFDYFKTEYQLRKSSSADPDDSFIKGFEMVMSILGKGLSATTDKAAD